MYETSACDFTASSSRMVKVISCNKGFLTLTAIIWLKYCPLDVKYQVKNQSIIQGNKRIKQNFARHVQKQQQQNV